MKNKTAWLIDSNIYVYEAWSYYKSPIKDQDGHPIQAVIGFLHFVYHLLMKERPAVIAFAFDEKLKHSHRKALYPAYKANRKPTPPELLVQFKYCRDFLDSLGLYQGSNHFYEADDLIGTWTRQLREQGYKLNLVSADKDLLQLIEQDDYWWSYQKNYKHNVKSFHKRFRIYPYQVADQLALAGDKSDNIPGIDGIGMSTAAKLLRKFGSIDEIFAQQNDIHKMQIHGAKQIQNAIIEHHDIIRLAQKLSVIKCDIAEVDSKNILQKRTINYPAFSKLCQQLQLPEERQTQWFNLIEALYPSIQAKD
jgi:5'-3' exonuclease